MNDAGLQIFCLRVVFFRQLLSYSRGCFFYFFPFLLNLHTILTFPPENLETGILLWRCQKQRGKRNRCLGVKVRRKTRAAGLFALCYPLIPSLRFGTAPQVLQSLALQLSFRRVSCPLAAN